MKTIRNLSLITIFALFFSLNPNAYSAEGDLSGTASSATAGDINLAGARFNTSTNLGSGHAVSARIGDVSFNNNEVSSNTEIGCPGGATNCGPSITWNPDGSGVMKGYIRSCSVFASGCSGFLKGNIYRGGWDGFINLSDGTATNSGWGVKISDTGVLSGQAWGSDVVGWVTFTGSIAIASPGNLVVDAGPNQNVDSPNSSTLLSGSASISGGSGTVTSTTWSIVSLPSGTTPSISNTAILNPTVSGLTAAGTYTFRLSAIDNKGNNLSDTVNINVVIPSAGGSLSVLSCDIPLGASTCNASVNWNISTPIGGAPTLVNRDNPNILVSTNLSGTNISNAVNYGQSTFSLYHNGLEAAPPAIANVGCVSGGSWVGGMCMLAPSCPIGSTLVGGVCVATGCPNGQTLVGGICTDNSSLCPTGQIWNGAVCVLDINCPAPLVPNSSGICVACPTGMTYETATRSCINKKKPNITEF